MLALFVIWVIFNGRIGWDVIVVGLAVVALMGVLLKHAMGYSLKGEIMFIGRIPAVLRYIWVLLVEMVKANFAVMKLILSPYARLQGQMVFFTPELKTKNVRSVLANSITLTPGTITVQMRDGRYCIHTIRDEFVEDIEHSTLVNEAARLEAKFSK